MSGVYIRAEGDSQERIYYRQSLVKIQACSRLAVGHRVNSTVAPSS
jgi:hypothetical protein